MDELRFDGAVALVTGVSMNGLGWQYAKSLAEHGARVVVNDLGVDWAGNPSGAETDAVVDAVRSLGGEAHGITGDVVTDAEQIVAAAIEAFGRLDIVVNNAGAGGDFDTLIDVHLRGSNNITQAAWPHLIDSGKGRIVNIASSGIYGAPAMPGYAAGKSGVVGLTRSQALLGAPHGIRSNVIMPSAWTRSTAGINVAGMAEFMETYLPPEEVASFVTYLAHESVAVTGELFAVGGGLVCRIVLAETAGVSARGNTPAQWAEAIGQVLDTSELDFSTTMWEHLTDFVGKLSPEARAAFANLGINTRVAGKMGD